MDSLTQIVLGAGVGEAVLGRKIGNKAILWGAIGGTIPDLDVFLQFFLSDIHALYLHRSFSHSILFFVLISPILALLVQKIHKKCQVSFKEWTFYFFMVTFTHAILDSFTSWGTQLFWPMPWRIRFNNIFVADPLYTVPFLTCIVVLMWFHRTSSTRRKINNLGLILSSGYMALTIVFKLLVLSDVKADLEIESVEYSHLSTRPSPLNSILWNATVEKEGTYLLGYRSLFDTGEMEWTEMEKNWHLIDPYKDNIDVQRVIFLSQGYYIAIPDPDGIYIIDLRFGQPEGIMVGDDRFVFGYHVSHDVNGAVVVKEKPRPDPSWEEVKAAFGGLFERAKGI